MTRAGPEVLVKSVKWLRRAEGYTVYNFEVEDDHTYFVGTVSGGVWVHNPSCTWTSPAGLEYETGSAQGNRVSRVFEHLADNPSKPRHGVFDVGSSQELLDVVDQAWLKRGLPEPGDPGAYIIDMGTKVGTKGERSVKIIVRPGTSKIITAYPHW